MLPEAFEKDAHTAMDRLKEMGVDEVLIVHHDDADGLASAAITKTAMEREGYGTKTLCLEKLYPEVVENIHAGEGRVVFYCDIGSPHADKISDFNQGRNLVIILDHHDPAEATDPNVYDLNLEHYGFRGETDFSGATCNYLFARSIGEWNADLSYLALVGSQEIPGGLQSLNLWVLRDAEEHHIVQVKRKSIKIIPLGISVKQLFKKLQILGAVGYYQGGPELGIKAALEGLTPEINRFVEELEERRKSANRKLLERLRREGLNETEHIQWFSAGDAYRGMGAKTIGTFCSYLTYQRVVKQDKYLLGFMPLEPVIPGYGELKGSYLKASVRTPRLLSRLIDEGRRPTALKLLQESTRGFGISADGHAYAASVVLPTGKMEEMIERADRFVSDFNP